MHNLVHSSFNRAYNPTGKENALSDIKRLLTSRDNVAQSKACGCLIEVINRYKTSTTETTRVVEYLLNNDITLFLCEATSNLDFSLFRLVLQCLRLLWRERRFFAEEHAAHAMTAVLRALAHYSGSELLAAVDACLHFLCDLLNGVKAHQTTPPLSHQSAYSAEQLLACLNGISSKLSTNSNNVLSSALVLHGLISYQPPNLDMRGQTTTMLVEVLAKWFALLMEALNHSSLIADNLSGMFFVVTCQLGIDVLRLIKLLQYGKQKVDFVQTILTDDHEINTLKQCACEMRKTIQHTVTQLVAFTKENQKQITTEDYGVFLQFLLNFLYEDAKTESSEFCDVLFSNGYLTMLPQVQILRNDTMIRKTSILIIAEILKVLAEKYLNIDDMNHNNRTCARDIHMGLVELQRGIEKPQTVGMQLQKSQPYSLLIYIYFYCQSTENPEESTAPLLPYLVEHILRLPKTFKPPAYIIKALWLVFAMSTISNGSLESLDERVYLEKAIDRMVTMLHPDPSIYYTHNPGILLWAFTSRRIPDYVRIHVLSEWFKTEVSLPNDLRSVMIVWELLLQILIQIKNKDILENCMKALYECIEEGTDDAKNDFALTTWSLLPRILSTALIDYDSAIETNICYLLDLATVLIPIEVDQTDCLKIAVIITVIFTKNNPEQLSDLTKPRYNYKYVCLKLSLCLLNLSNNQKDNRVLMIYINRVGFLPSVLSATNSMDDRVACAAMQLLSYIVHYFNKNNYQPKSVLQIQTELIIKSLRNDTTSERGMSLLQLVYMMLNSGINTPLVLSHNVESIPSPRQQCNALRALMFRVQMLCCRASKDQSTAGWKILSAVFKHAIITKTDPKLIATLTSQPWTHTLVQFQLTQSVTQEFLTFAHNWLSLLKITIKKSQEAKRTQISKYSLINKSLILLKKNLMIEDELKEGRQKVLVVVKEICEEYGITSN